MSDIATQETPPNHRGLLALVIGLGVLFVIAVVVSIVIAVTRQGHGPAASRAGAFALPKGAVIVAMESQPNRLILHLRAPEGEEIDIVDLTDGHLVARIQ